MSSNLAGGAYDLWGLTDPSRSVSDARAAIPAGRTGGEHASGEAENELRPLA
ncbi:MAG: hypothetical protein RML93_13840 [Anaerolineales bacterium]|nr:hypothetical protein [Anaerolineales bacterium]MCS7247781.1 hypothetical protein [Anaerolineales bacterium]MDW8161591.1 hypothetical protein [Anaerolineales bacterium]MDW8448355.1 hypothetical protein [Anaerolineales bacterium]